MSKRLVVHGGPGPPNPLRVFALCQIEATDGVLAVLPESRWQERRIGLRFSESFETLSERIQKAFSEFGGVLIVAEQLRIACRWRG